MVSSVRNIENQVLIEKNDKVDNTFIERLTDYAGKTIGSLRILSLIRSGARLRNELDKTPSVVAIELDKATTASMSALGIVRLPSVTKDAYDALANVAENDGVSTTRKTAVAIRDVLEAVTSWCNATGFFISNLFLKRTAQVADLGSDTADLCLSVNDYKTAALHEEASVGEAKEAFAHTRKYYMLRVAKAILSVASAFFGVLMLITGLKLLPVVAALLLSLGTTMVAIRRDWFKDEGKYKLVDLSVQERIV